MSKYEPLIEYLRARNDDKVSLAFPEIESILGAQLPPSSKTRPEWWSNSSHKSHSWAVDWLEAGWASDILDLDAGTVTFRRVAASLTHDADSREAIEGYTRDRRLLARTRNRTIADTARKRDDHRCQSCQFRLCYDGRFVIDVHHCNPLALTDKTTTRLDDLICLCPTCHRIAHLRSPNPLETHEIIAVRGAARVG